METDLQEQFNILPADEIETRECVLAMHVSDHYFSYCIYESHVNKLRELKRFKLESVSLKYLDIIFDQNKNLCQPFHRIITWLDFKFSTLLPASMVGNDISSLVYLEKGDEHDHVITEYLQSFDLANLYSVPPSILSWIVQHFPSSGFLHKHSALIQSVVNATESGLLRIEVLDQSFTVIVFKGDQLLLAQDYVYKAPDDIAFYLLKICELNGLSQLEVNVQISGLIDAQSKIYRTIYDYFQHVSFTEVTWTNDRADIPAHYFTSLNQLATCELLQEA